MPGVQVIVTNVSTGEVSHLTTNSAGFYLVPDLVPGTYTISFEATGFAKLEVTSAQVQAGTALTMDGNLKLGKPLKASMFLPLRRSSNRPLRISRLQFKASFLTKYRSWDATFRNWSIVARRYTIGGPHWLQFRLRQPIRGIPGSYTHRGFGH